MEYSYHTYEGINCLTELTAESALVRPVTAVLSAIAETLDGDAGHEGVALESVARTGAVVGT